MLDGTMRRMIDPPLNAAGRQLARAGLSANLVTLVGLAIGLAAAGAIYFGRYEIGLVLILISRLADGLDGAIARATTKTDFGGYLDITADFLFYGAIPMAFVWADPADNAIAGAFLLISFYVNGASFLGFAVLAEKRQMETNAQGQKSLYYSNGLLEGTETLLFFASICLWPAYFPALAWLFGVACFATAGLRVRAAYEIFRN